MFEALAKHNAPKRKKFLLLCLELHLSSFESFGHSILLLRFMLDLSFFLGHMLELSIKTLVLLLCPGF